MWNLNDKTASTRSHITVINYFFPFFSQSLYVSIISHEILCKKKCDTAILWTVSSTNIIIVIVMFSLLWIRIYLLTDKLWKEKLRCHTRMVNLLTVQFWFWDICITQDILKWLYWQKRKYIYIIWKKKELVPSLRCCGPSVSLGNLVIR